MELKLVVLAGAKEGTQIPLKKDEFVIGRSSDCTLRAGSGAISRRHCAIVREGDAWLARDLGSRNGTFLNDQALAAPTALKIGDELRVGPLKFRVDSAVRKAAAGSTVGKAASGDAPQDINRAKRPAVKDVSEVTERTAAKSDSLSSEEDISRWLLGTVDSPTNGDGMRETQTLSLQETTAVQRAMPKQPSPPAEATSGETSAEEVDLAPADESVTAEEPESSSGSGGWSFFKKGKKSAKSKPGKLPPRPSEQSKDSREAASEILREMTRRR